ncbi:uncharacterized protein LOC134696298 [Mytilus trossulus]|uniref:uncharacterized protein LOC134696298 n=1 Tax=Mytilus trossulus TaxID=6551 RepID=UPI00300771D9
METYMISALVFLYFCNLIFSSSAQEPYMHTVCEYITSTRYYYCPLLNKCCYLNGKWKCIDQIDSIINGDYGNQPSCENYKRKPTSKGPSSSINKRTGYTINTYSTDDSDETISSGTIGAIVIFLVFTVPSCMFCCIFYVRKANAKKRKIIRIQQSRTVRPISEQSQYRIMGLYHDNGNSSTIITHPQTEGRCLDGGERRDTSTLENDNGSYLHDDTTYTSTVHPPSYEDIINRNAAAIDSVDPRTHTSVDVEGLANSTINNSYVTNVSDHTASVPKVNQHTPMV